VVDRSLLGKAADHGVTICFADLEGADGLWVPEERTILVSRRLSGQRLNEVIEHELQHVAIDAQHEALDAGVWDKPGRTPVSWLSQRWAAPALSVAAFVALVGGVTAGLAATRPNAEDRSVVVPSPTMAPSAVDGVPQPTTTTITITDSNGNVVVRTVTITPSLSRSAPSGSPTPTRPGAGTPTSSRRPSGVATTPAVPPTGTATTPPDTTTTAPPDTTTPTPTTSAEPDTPTPTPTAESVGATGSD
jgi:hypothetical protein